MTKKTNKLAKIKLEFAASDQARRDAVGEANEYKAILNQIHDILRPGVGYSNRLLFKELPKEIMRLEMYRANNEGASKPFQMENEQYREIIRWLIKPSTADNSKELETYKKQFGIR